MQTQALSHSMNLTQTENPYLANPLAGLSLVARLIATPSGMQVSPQQKCWNQLHELVNIRFSEVAAQDDYPHKAKAFRDLQVLTDSLIDKVAFPLLAARTVIAVGGALGAGKSLFLNTLCDTRVLPEAVTPTYAIPAYLTHGNQESIVAINSFNHAATLDASALQAISKGFEQQASTGANPQNGFAHVLRVLMLQQPDFLWHNLVFLDTPGYSSVKALAAHADAGQKLQVLQHADYVIWVVDARHGGISEEELGFLQSLKLYRPVFIVLTQTEQLSNGQRIKLIDSTRRALSQVQEPVAGVMAWAANSNPPFTGGNDLYSWLGGLNNTSKRTGIRLEYTRIMDEYIEFHRKGMADNQKQLALLNKLLLLGKLHGTNTKLDFLADLNKAIVSLKQAQAHFQQQKNVLTQLKGDLLPLVTELLGGTKVKDIDLAESGFLKGERYLQADNMAQALAYWQKSAEAGYAPACLKMGECFEQGNGVKKDINRAIDWYKKAAEQGNPVAQYQLGVMYASIPGLAKDLTQAAEWYCKAEEQGYIKAQCALGMMYDKGQQITK